MSVSLLRLLFGGAAGIFAVLLLGLPLWRVMQARLPLRRAVGLWVGGGGFACLAVASVTPEPEAWQRLVFLGVVMAAGGTMLQRWMDGREEADADAD